MLIFRNIAMKEKVIKIFKSKNTKSALKVISFILVFLILLQLLSSTAFSSGSSGAYKNSYTRAYSFLSEPDHSIEVACIGNSDLYSAFVPMRLWNQYGYTSTVISKPHQTTLNSYTLMRELLEKQSPKVMIIETDMFYEDAPKLKNGNELSKTDKLKLRAKYALSFFSQNKVEESISSHFRVFTFHDRWKSLTFRDIKDSLKKSKYVTIDHGYNFNNSVKPGKANDCMKKTDKTERISDESMIYIDKMISLCKEKNISVIFVQMPSLHSWNYSRHNTVQQIADLYGIEFIDFNLKLQEIDFDISSDYRDGGDHLNFYGATKTTHYLGDYIHREYSSALTDRRNDDNYSYWPESNDEFCKKYKVK